MSETSTKVLNVALWVVQGLLALAFLAAGVMKSTQPIDSLVANGLVYAKDIPHLIRFIGVSELLGAIGLILPAALRILPWLTTLAAALLGLVMVFALIFHAARGELAMAIIPNVSLGLMAAFVAAGRQFGAPITAR